MEKCFTVAIRYDLKVEPDEQFTLLLSETSHPAIYIDPNTLTVTILNDDSEDQIAYLIELICVVFRCRASDYWIQARFLLCD